MTTEDLNGNVFDMVTYLAEINAAAALPDELGDIECGGQSFPVLNCIQTA